MLVSFAVDSDAIQEDADDPLLAENSLRELAAQWEQFGLLMYGLKADADNHLLDAIDALPQHLKKMWWEALRHNRFMELDFHWSGPANMQAPRDVEEECRQVPDLDCVLVDEVRAEVLGLEKREYSKEFTSVPIEVSRYRYAARAKVFADVKKLSCRRINRNTLCDDVWDERFKRLAGNTGKIVIVDRYAYLGLMKNTANDSGIETFCRKLARIGSRVSIEVYSAFQDPRNDGYKVQDYRDLLRRLVADIRGSGIRNAKFYIGENARFRDESHGRYIRFDRTLCRLDTGLNVLEGDRVTQACDFVVLTRSDESDNVEKYLRDKRLGQPEGWS